MLISVVASSLVFGSLHLLDFKLENVSAEIAQLFYATFIGIGFGAIFLRTGRLWALALIHGIIDFVFNIDELPVFSSPAADPPPSIAGAIITVLVTSPMLVIGLRIIRKLEANCSWKEVAFRDN